MNNILYDYYGYYNDYENNNVYNNQYYDQYYNLVSNLIDEYNNIYNGYGSGSEQVDYYNKLHKLLNDYNSFNKYYKSKFNAMNNYYNKYNKHDVDIYDDDNYYEEESGVSFGTDLGLTADASVFSKDELARVILFATNGYAKDSPGPLDLDKVATVINVPAEVKEWKDKISNIRASCNSWKHPWEAGDYKKAHGVNRNEMTAAKMYCKTSGISFIGSKYQRDKATIDAACNSYTNADSAAIQTKIRAIPGYIQNYIKVLKSACLKAERYAALKATYDEQKAWVTAQKAKLEDEYAKDIGDREEAYKAINTLAKKNLKKSYYDEMIGDNHLFLYIGMGKIPFTADEVNDNTVTTDVSNTWYGPTSASLDWRVAKKFAKTGTILILKVPVDHGGYKLANIHPNYGFLNVISISPYPEAEILQWDIPKAIVEILNSHSTEDGGGVWNVIDKWADTAEAEGTTYVAKFKVRKENWEEWGQSFNCRFQA